MNPSLNGLYVITDPNLISDNLLEFSVREVLEGGARIVQYRNKKAGYAKQLAQAKALHQLTRQYSAKLLINDSVQLCLESDADGVHLGQKDGISQDIRDLLKGKLLGITCHSSIELARKAIDHGADYCAFGAVYTSKTKPEASPCTLETLKEASKLPVPICAIGGIDATNARMVLDQKVEMLAVISGVFGKPNIRDSAQAISSLF